MIDASYVPRRATELVREAMTGFRVTVVNGPRQSGKSTLLAQLNRTLAGTLVTLDDRTALRTARTDPSGFVEGYPYPMMIDEVQRGGDGLVLAVKALVDRTDRPGQVVLAGSSRFLTVPTLTESLAGRARIIDLWPLSQGEMCAGSDALLDRLFLPTPDVRQLAGERLTRRAAMERVVLGGFPGVHKLAPPLRRDWFADYRRTLIQRDLSEIRRLRQVAEVPRLVRLMATCTAQELNIARLATSLGLAAGTVHAHLSLLEVIYVHHLLPGWSRRDSPAGPNEDQSCTSSTVVLRRMRSACRSSTSLSPRHRMRGRCSRPSLWANSLVNVRGARLVLICSIFAIESSARSTSSPRRATVVSSR